MISTDNARAAAGVIIVNYNSGDILQRCISALRKQTFTDFMAVIVDNGSSDNSLCFLEEAGADIEIIKTGQNLGFAAANNLAFEYLADKVEFLALLNPDAFPEPGWLESLMSAAAEYPEIAAFASKQLSCMKTYILDGTGDHYHYSGMVWRERFEKRHDYHMDNERREIFSCCAAAALYRKKPLMEVSGFDEDFFCYLEDVDLGFRLLLAGYRSLYVPEAVVQHVGSATTGSRHSDFSIYHGHRNLVWTYVKDMPALLFWIFLPVHIMLNCISLIRFIIQGRGYIICKAKLDAIRGLPGMWKKRRIVQSTRRSSVKDIWKMIDKRIIPPVRF